MFSFFRKKSPVIPFYDKTPVTVQRDEFTSGNAVHPWHHAFDNTVVTVNPLYTPHGIENKVNEGASKVEILIDAFEKERPE
jgi:hypothetical protein